jgi:hypothetical protein
MEGIGGPDDPVPDKTIAGAMGNPRPARSREVKDSEYDGNREVVQ